MVIPPFRAGSRQLRNVFNHLRAVKLCVFGRVSTTAITLQDERQYTATCNDLCLPVRPRQPITHGIGLPGEDGTLHVQGG